MAQHRDIPIKKGPFFLHTETHLQKKCHMSFRRRADSFYPAEPSHNPGSRLHRIQYIYATYSQHSEAAHEHHHTLHNFLLP